MSAENHAGASAALEVRGISFGYDGTPVLAEVSLTVGRGTIVGIVGRNGAGKSTLINLLCGLLTPAEGTAEVFGGTSTIRNPEMLRHTGWLLSEPALFQYLTPRETLAFLAEAYSIPPLEASARIADLLRFFELEESDGTFADELSTGNTKRLAIAAAMVHAPSLLVLDEPFESLDPLMVRRLRSALFAYARKGGSILLSSHLLDVVQDLCDRVYILERGAVVYDGSREEVRGGASEVGTGSPLEALYASLVDSGADFTLDWLCPAG